MIGEYPLSFDATGELYRRLRGGESSVFQEGRTVTCNTALPVHGPASLQPLYRYIGDPLRLLLCAYLSSFGVSRGVMCRVSRVVGQAEFRAERRGKRVLVNLDDV